MKYINNLLATFQRSPLLEDFCRKYNGRHISEIHHSFANMDRFAAIIRKLHLQNFPSGRDYLGVVREYETNHLGKSSQYIQNIYCEGPNLMIICFFREQVEWLHTLMAFEVDMLFKRVKTQGLNEVVFATYLPKLGKGII